MSWRKIKNRKSILKAIKEYDELRRDKFQEKYGNEDAKEYALTYNGNLYDPQAILNAAYQYEYKKEPSKKEMSGAKGRQKKLQNFGFEVIHHKDLSDFLNKKCK